MAIVVIIAISASIIINQYINIRKLKLDNEIAKLSIKEIRNNYEMRIRLSECDSSQMDALKKKNAALLLENMRLKQLIDAYRNVYWWTSQLPQISQDMVDTVKYAMKKTHPDNGGNSEDFVKFKKAYEELTNK